MSERRIGVDCDGVIADFNTAYIDLVIKVSGENKFPLKPFDIPCWDYPEHFGYSKAVVRDVWKQIGQDPYFWATLPRYSYTKEILERLSKVDIDGGTVYFITTRIGLNPKRQTATWLVNSGFNGWPTVIVTKKKGPVIQGLELDAFIDDKPSNCIDAVRYSSCPTYMLNQPWNQDFTDLRTIKRVDTVDQFLKEVL